MKTPTMTLAEIERALEAQNRELEAAFEEFRLRNRGQKVAVSLESLRRLRELGEVPTRTPRPSDRAAGIRC